MNDELEVKIPRRRGRPPKIKTIKPSPVLESITPPEPVLHAPALKAELSPPAQVPPITTAIAVNDVAQVISQNSQYYGVLFQIGDMQGGKVHGFYMMPGGRKEFVTVGLEECFPIGVSKIRSKDPMSPQWRLEHKKV